MLDPAHQIALRERPSGRAAIRQSWRDLLFLHFPCDPEEVRGLLPPGLSVDTFPNAEGAEKAWIGLVPFVMKDVRWAFAPPVPGTHTFPETNVRTYVHREGREPGVWFFSLDAANRLAVAAARAAFSLPYFHARMRVSSEEDRASYSGERSTAGYSIQAAIGAPRGTAEPGSLEFFLVERYRLYAERRGRLLTGRVFHPPYTLRAARVERCEESLVTAAGLRARPFVHALWSAGVDVEVFPLLRPY